MELGTFVLQLTQPSVEPLAGQSKWRKLGPSKYFPTELPGAINEDVAVDADPAAGRPTPAGPQAMAVETAAPVAEEMHLSLPLSPRLRHGHNTPSDSFKNGSFLRSRKRQKE